MHLFYDWPIRRKLTVIIMLASAIVLVLACSAFVLYDQTNYRKAMREDLNTLAEIIGANSRAALTMAAISTTSAKARAEDVLGALNAKREVIAAALYKDDQLLASYQGQTQRRFPAPSKPGPDGLRADTDALEVFYPVVEDKDRLGTLYLRSSTAEAGARLRRFSTTVGIIFAAALALVVLISSKLQELISLPILALADTARRVSEEKNYAVRAEKHGKDEVGFLIDQFNEMLVQIQKREEALEAANRQSAESEQKALAATQAKSQFLASMSHELRTPLNAIIGYSEMLEEEAPEIGADGMIPDLQKIQLAAKHQLGLINDILDLSKVEAGKMTLFIEEFEIGKLLSEVASTVQPLIAKNSNQLVIECGADMGVMRADQTKVRQTLFNLLSNASKFTDKGTIRLEVQRVGQTISFVVTDSGIGMTPDQVGKLFQAFSQADASTTKKFGGTGLGLALSRSFCQMMGGDVTVRSQLGKGSVFTVTLPADVQDPSRTGLPAVAYAAAGAEPAQGNGTTVLVIDDDPNACDLMSRVLGKEGYRVELASNGSQGLEMAARLKPTVITLDVIMPGMDGWAVLTALKANPDVADTPVIMMTMLDDKNLAFSLGAADYLTKPVDWDQLNRLLVRYGLAAQEPKVLVVDDDPAVREILQRGLEKAGCQVRVAENGRAALSKLAGQTPGLILLDLMMPEMDGFEFLRQLRARPEGRHVPVIVITSKDLTEDDYRRLHGSVAEILQKGGYSFDELLAQIRTLVSARRGTANDAPDRRSQPV